LWSSNTSWARSFSEWNKKKSKVVYRTLQHPEYLEEAYKAGKALAKAF